jgi:uncharacterized phage-like protein YoqJ
MTTWCATGHRPEKLGGYSDEARHRLEQFAVTYLRYYAPDLFISGMAQGWDQACAYACTVLSIPWTAAIPFAGQESMWPDAAQKRYTRLLEGAERIECVSTGGFSKRARQVRNEWMVDNATDVLASWDGSPGGTGNCIRYAIHQNKRGVNLWPQWCGSAQ